MVDRIEDLALLSDTESAALVDRDGSVVWLTFPRFDSPACFAALLGTDDDGRWRIAPAANVVSATRRYRPDTLVLETRWQTDDGVVEVIDAMPVRADGRLDMVRLVRGVEGRVAMRVDLTVRMDYGSLVPWVHRTAGGLRMVAGPDALTLWTPAALEPEGFSTISSFEVSAGDEVPFDLAWCPSHLPSPTPVDVADAIERTTGWWQEWAGRGQRFEHWDEPIRSSLTVLKGLTYAPTGGIVAAASTSLPERIGGDRNWDYRYCWLRDATFTLTSLLDAGHTEEAAAWRDWLLRAVAGRPQDAQIMYGPAGEHRLDEVELPWLSGFESSLPVRTGNGAHGQFQLDVYGEVLDAFAEAERAGIPIEGEARALCIALAEAVAQRWSEPDDGIWEVRGGRRHFTHSKLMAWVALDRAIPLAAGSARPAPVDRWRRVRDEIRAEILARGVDVRGRFVQTFDGAALDASLLLVPLVGFLPADDPRVVATVDAIERELTYDGFVRRYDPEVVDDGVGGTEGTFLMCSFWLADVMLLQGRVEEATALFERLVGLRNDVGLMAEMWDPDAKRMLGNIPQAFSHTALASTGMALARHRTGEACWQRGGERRVPR